MVMEWKIHLPCMRSEGNKGKRERTKASASATGQNFTASAETLRIESRE